MFAGSDLSVTLLIESTGSVFDGVRIGLGRNLWVVITLDVITISFMTFPFQ